MSIQINVRIKNREIWEKFKDFVLKKYGKLHSVLGDELIEAMKLYLEVKNGEMHAHTNIAEVCMNRNDHGPPSKTMRTLTRIINKIKNQFQLEISQPDVELIITEEAGGDPRTIRKYLRYLQIYGFISRDRPIRGMRNKWIYRVNQPIQKEEIMVAKEA